MEERGENFKKYYAGIGSRKTPPDILKKMETISSILNQRGWVLRSGGAEGADQAFENPIKEKKDKQIFLPWPGFNEKSSKYNRVCDWAMEIAEQFHPNWENLKIGIRLLIARNTYQILGPDQNSWPSLFVVCWTADGKASGGTGQALRIAQACKIPIYNLYFKEHEERLNSKIFQAIQKEVESSNEK